MLRILSSLKKVFNKDSGKTEDAPGAKFIMKLYSYWKNEINIFFELELIKGCSLLS